MADRYWVGGTGTWNTSSTTNWSASSGGGSGASVPTTADNVFFDQAGTYTVTFTNALACLDFTITAGTVTFVTGTTPTLDIRGSMSLRSGTVWTSNLGISFTSTSTGRTIDTAGTTLNGAVIFNGVGGGWTLSNPLTTILGISVLNGAFNTNNFNLSIGSLASVGTATRSITLGTSTVTLTSSGGIVNIPSATGLTFSAASSIIQSSDTAGTFLTPGLTFGTVNFTNNGSVANSSIIFSGGSNTFTALSFASRTGVAGISVFTFPAGTTQTIGTLSLNTGTASSYRKFLRSSTIGTAVNFAVTTFNTATDIDFRDISATGVAFSGTRFGNCQGNTNISFDTAKTVYYRNTGSNSWGTGTNGSWVVPISLPGATCTGTALTTTTSPALVVGMTIVTSNGTSLGTITAGSINAWTVSVGGTFTTPQTMLAFAATSDPTMFPLAQDTAVFTAGVFPATGTTTTINANYNIGTIDMSARTSNTMTLAIGTTLPAVYGNWINGTGSNNSTGSGTITFAGRGSQTLTSATKSFACFIFINTPGGSVTLQDQLTCTGASGGILNLTAGTFDANGFAVSLNNSGFSSSNSNVRTLAFGTGGSATWTIGGSGVAWATNISTNLTVTGSATVSMTNASPKSFQGGSISYSGMTLNQGGAGSLTIIGSNTFANITNTVQPTTITFSVGETQTVSSFSVSGTAGNLVTINSSIPGLRANLSKSSGTVSVSYCSIKDINATGGATWNAFTSNGNTDAGNNLGWVFAAVAASTGNFLMLF